MVAVPIPYRDVSGIYMTEKQSGSGAGNKAQLVSQPGFVEEMQGNRAFVRIYQNSSCGSCQLQGGCSSKSLGGNSGRLVEAVAGEGVSAGARVRLQMRASDGVLSVLLSFALPLIIVFTLILSLQSRGISDEVLALSALGSVVLYYGGLSLFRSILKARISFTAVLDDEFRPEVCEVT